MPETEQKPYRLAGICKKCHQFRFGYLPYGTGPFTCYNCGEAAAHARNQQDQGTTAAGTTGIPVFFTFTITSNDSSSTWREGSA